MKKWVGIVAFGFGIITLSAWKLRKAESVESSVSQTPAQITKQTVVTSTAPAPMRREPLQPAKQTEAVQQFSKTFDGWLKLQRSMHRHQRKEQLKELAQNAAAVAVASNILATPNFAKQHFGTQQAEARVFALDVLRAASTQGNVAAAEETTQQLVQRLLEGTLPKNEGRVADLHDLVRIIVDADSSRFIADPEGFLATLSFDPRLKIEFADALYRAYLTKNEGVAAMPLLKKHVFQKS